MNLPTSYGVTTNTTQRGASIEKQSNAYPGVNHKPSFNSSNFGSQLLPLLLNIIIQLLERILSSQQNPADQQLVLSDEQEKAIGKHFNTMAPPGSADFPTTRFTGVVIDSDRNGQLSVGDKVQLETSGGITGEISTRFHEITESDLAAINANTPPEGPVSGGQITIGSTSPFGNGDIPNSEIVDISGQQYSVGFLKLQLDGYVNSDFSMLPPDVAVATVAGQHPWGTSNTSYFGGAFENYISQTFPNGEPD